MEKGEDNGAPLKQNHFNSWWKGLEESLKAPSQRDAEAWSPGSALGKWGYNRC